MKGNKTFKWSLITLCVLCSLSGQAQETSNISLRSILDQIEQRFDVSFTYMDQTIDSLKLPPPDRNLDLQQTILYLEGVVELRFVFLDDKYISVIPLSDRYNFCGYLIDSENRDPVSGALVSSAQQHTVTDQNGYFILSQSEPGHPIIARHVGYEDAILTFDDAKAECQTFYLKPSTSVLDELVIQSYIIRGIDKKVGGQVEVDIQNTNILPGLTEPDVFFTMQILPGVQSTNETVTDINIRGGSNDQNLMLWDGVRLYQTGHFFGLISAVNPYIIDKSSIIKNGTSAKLGEGVSGVILIETPVNRAETFSAQVGSNMINSDQLLQIPLRNTSVMIASRQSLSGLVLTPIYNQYFERAFHDTDVLNAQGSNQVVNSNERFGFYDFSFNTVSDFSNATKLKTGFLTINNSIRFDESAVVNSKLISRSSNLDQGSVLGFISLSHKWTDRLQSRFYGSITNYKQESINFDVLTDQRHVLENEVLESSLKGEISFRAKEKWVISSGLQLVETGIRNFRDINTPEFRSLSKEVNRTSSAFFESSLNPHQNADLILGIRTSYFDKIDHLRVEPRLSALIRLGGAFTMEILAESKSQTSVQSVDFQTDFLGVEKRKWELINNQSIPLLTSNQASLGFNYKKGLTLLSLEGFIKEVDGVITSSQGFLNQYQFTRSIGSYLARGIELLINPRFKDVDTWMTYTFLNSDYTFPELVTPTFRSNFDISHSLSAGLSYQLKKFQFSSGINYRSGLPFTNQLGFDQNSESIIYDYPNNISLEPYFRLDFSVKYSFPISDKIEGRCGVAIWNVTNKDNIIGSYYRLQGSDSEQVYQHALRFTPNVNFRLIFNP